MPYPLKTSLSESEFRSQVIDYYWSDWKARLEKVQIQSLKRDVLADDFAKIGAFLSDRARVEKALEPLETRLREQIDTRTLKMPESYSEAEPHTTPSKLGAVQANLKAHKLLTNALRESEALNGFNHEGLANGTFHDDAKQQQRGTFHSNAGVADKTGKLSAMEKDSQDAKLPSSLLPRGAPTIVGDLDPLAFNVLLRHGYQFKDVGAGPYHGEYTHRLQWYAIVNANLGLGNSPLDVLRSLGYLVMKADQNLPTDGRQLWMWQALFDTAETADDATRLNTVAYTSNGAVFNCPENMNKSLMRLDSNIASRGTVDSLWFLRVLLKTRWKKRFDEAAATGTSKLTGIDKVVGALGKPRPPVVLASMTKQQSLTEMTDEPITKGLNANKINPKTNLPYTKKVPVTRVVTVPVASLDQSLYALAWYLRNDDVN